MSCEKGRSQGKGILVVCGGQFSGERRMYRLDSRRRCVCACAFDLCVLVRHGITDNGNSNSPERRHEAVRGYVSKGAHVEAQTREGANGGGRKGCKSGDVHKATAQGRWQQDKHGTGGETHNMTDGGGKGP